MPWKRTNVAARQGKEWFVSIPFTHSLATSSQQNPAWAVEALHNLKHHDGSAPRHLHSSRKKKRHVGSPRASCTGFFLVNSFFNGTGSEPPNVAVGRQKIPSCALLARHAKKILHKAQKKKNRILRSLGLIRLCIHKNLPLSMHLFAKIARDMQPFFEASEKDRCMSQFHLEHLRPKPELKSPTITSFSTFILFVFWLCNIWQLTVQSQQIFCACHKKQFNDWCKKYSKRYFQRNFFKNCACHPKGILAAITFEMLFFGNGAPE